VTVRARVCLFILIFFFFFFFNLPRVNSELSKDKVVVSKDKDETIESTRGRDSPD